MVNITGTLGLWCQPAAYYYFIMGVVYEDSTGLISHKWLS